LEKIVSTPRIKRNDTVVAIAGVDVGKTGKVLHILPKRGRAIVEGLKIVKKCMRKTQDNPQGGISQKESSVNLSNLMVYCPECKKGVRTRRVKEGDKYGRRCRTCSHSFDG